MAADIVSTATLDASALNEGFNKAIKAARQFRADIDKALDFSPLDKAIKASREFKAELSTITAREVAELNKTISSTNDAMHESVEAARAQAASVTQTAQAAAAAGDGFDAIEDRIRDTLAALQEWQESGDRTEESFNRLKQQALDLFDSAIVDAAGDQAVALEQLRNEIDALSFSQVQAVWATEDIEDAVKRYRYATLSLYNDVRQGLVTQEEGKRLARELKEEINATAAQTERWSKEYYGLSVAAGRAESILAQLEGRVTAVGHAKSVQVGTTHLLAKENNALALSYQRVGQAITAALTAAGLTKYLRTLRGLADEATTAQTHVRLFYSEAAAVGQLNTAIALLGDLRRELGLTEGQLSEAGASLLNVGVNVKQAGELIRAGAALAERSNRPLAEGIDAVTQAMVLGRREALASLGVRVDFTRAINDARTATDGSTRSLTAQEEALARYGEILRVAAEDVNRFGEGQVGFSRALTRYESAMKRFREVSGEGARTFLGPLLGLLGRAINLFNALPSPIRTAALGLALLGTAVAGVGVAYFTLQGLLVKTQIVQTGVNALVANEALLRTNLGKALVGLAARYKLLSREQVVANATAIRASKGMTLMSVASSSLRGGLTRATSALTRFTVAGIRFVFTPIGAVITAIALAVGLITLALRRFQQVAKPAFDAFRGSVQSLQAAFKRLVAEGTVLGDLVRGIGEAFRQVLITIAKEAALVVLRLAYAIGHAATVVQFWNDVMNEGWGTATRNFSAANAKLEADIKAVEDAINGAASAARDGVTAIDDVGDAAGLTAEQLEELARKTKAAQDTLEGFQNRFRSMRLDLMPDGAEKDIAKVREEFRLLRNEIRKAAEENDQFKPFEKQLLAEAFELEQQQILAIQKDYADKRLAEAKKQAKELADAIKERERAIVDAQTRGRLNQADALTLEYRRRIEDTETLYGELIARAKEYGQDNKRLEELRAQELLAIHQGYERDVLAIYDELYANLEDRQRELLRAAAEERGDQRGLAGIQYATELRALTDFYDTARKEAAGNAALLAAIEEQETAERRAIRERYWRDVMRITQEGADAITARERDLALARAEFAEDQESVLRLNAAAELREIHAAYDQLEAAADGNARELERIHNLRNQEVELANQKLAQSLQDLADNEFAVSMEPVVANLTRDLDTASEATLRSIETQLRSWRNAYSSNGEVVAFVDAALEKVADRYERLADDATKHIDDIVESTRQLTSGIFDDDARRDLSDLDRALFDNAQKQAELLENQQAIAKAMSTAVGTAREELAKAAQDNADAMEVIRRQTTRDAERLTREALEAYQAGLETAKADASRAAVELVTSDVRNVIGRLTALQADSVQEARLSLLRAIATLTTRGVDSAALEPLREQVGELDDLLSQQARVTAEFAAGQMSVLRDVAAATLDEASAQRVAQATMIETIRLRKAALAEAKLEGASLEELATLTERVTTAQLDYVTNLQGQITALQNLRGEYASVFSTVSDLADLLGRPLPEAVIESQEKLATAALRNVRAAQEAGRSFADYGDDLQAAIGLWREYETASQKALEGQAQQLRGEFDLSGLLPNENRIRDLARRLTESFGIGITDAQGRVMSFIRGTTTSLFDGLETRQPIILSEIFSDLNKEATETPEIIESIDDQITTLTTQLEGLKSEIADAINFEAAGEELISGYKTVLDQVGVVTTESFDDAAGRAVGAFLERFDTERDRLREELEDKLGVAATAAGLSAGEGLMTAFATGVTANSSVLLRAVEAVLQQVRDRLPSSDAKRGPLSDLTHSGRMLVRTWLSGATAERARLGATVNGLLSNLTPGAGFTTATAAASAARGGIQTAQINNYFEGTPTQAAGSLDREARRFGQLAAREAAAQLRMRGRKH